jgi:hypothetical protein
LAGVVAGGASSAWAVVDISIGRAMASADAAHDKARDRMAFDCMGFPSPGADLFVRLIKAICFI